MPVVSVVIPAYNREKVIYRAIASVLAQTYHDFEVIIIDDASTDGTSGIVAGLAEKDERISLMKHATNKGAQAARNTGINNARGEWIAFLDSDDIWVPESLELRVAVAEKENVAVVHSDCIRVTDDGQERLGLPSLSGSVWRDLLAAQGPMFQGLLVRKSALEKISLLDEHIVAYQEWDTSIRLAKYYPFGFVNQPTFLYDCRGDDTISKNILRNATGYEQVVRKHRWDMLRLLGVKPLAQHYKRLAKQYQNANSPGKVRNSLMWIFLFQPNIGNLYSLKNAVLGDRGVKKS
jgi:glycosyltransferase involved in cell wall biosynthesis